MLVSRIVEEPHPALWAQAEAIFLTNRLERQCQHHRIPDDGFKIDVVVLNLVFESLIPRIREKLLNFDLHRLLHRVQAPTALADRDRVHVCADQDAVVQRLHPRLDVQLRTPLHADHDVAESLGNRHVEHPLAHLARAVHEVVHLDRVRGLDDVGHDKRV